MELHAFRSALIVLAAAFALACGQEKAEKKAAPPGPDPAAAAAEAAAAQAKEAMRKEAIAYYDTKCSECHGSRGAGNGLKSDTLSPKPRNFQDPEWQRSVKDSWIEEITVKGGVALEKSKDMPEHADLADKPELVAAIRGYIRTFDD
jgi:mono/diheme cytochrome c family protein